MGKELVDTVLLYLRNAIPEGINRGISAKRLDQIFEEKKNEMKADGRLIL